LAISLNFVAAQQFPKRGVAIACALLAISLTPAFAQTAPGAGDVLRDNSRNQPQLPPKADPQLPAAQPVRPALQAPNGFKVNVNGFRITGNKSVLETDLQLMLLDNLGKENTFAELQAATDRLSNYYRAKGYFVARAYLPQQEISGGIVEIAVLEGTVGKTRLAREGATRTGDAVFQRILDANVIPGATLRENELEKAALLANDLPAVGASITLDPGAATGQSDVTLNVNEGKLATITVDLDNYGNRFTGQTRLGTTLYLNSPLGLGDQFSFRAMGTSGDLTFGRANYQVPVGGSGTRVGVAWNKVNFAVCCQIGLNPSGEGRIATVYALQPLARSRNFSAYLNVSYDDKTSTNRSGIGASRVRDINLFTVSGSVESRDQYGGGGFNFLNVGLASGRLKINDPTDLAADVTGPNARGGFTKANIQVARTQRLTDRFSLYGGVNGQIAGSNLDAAEKFSLGGAQGVRGYPSGEAAGDSGYVAQFELRADLPIEAGNSQWQAFVFADRGGITINKNNYIVGGLTPNDYSLGSWGIGLNVAKAGLFQIRTMYAHKTGSNSGASPVTGADADGKSSRSRLWFQAVTQF
jgi:hemolysin activation/secretion protein